MSAAEGGVPEVGLTARALELETLDPKLFRAHPGDLWRPMGSRGVYGGQIVGQALVAATKTVDPTFKVHSLHSQFLSGGSNKDPILYWVEVLRDGKTYASRHVKASQDGKPIFSMLCSFALPESSSFSHQHRMPEVPQPEKLPDKEDLNLKLLERSGLPANTKDKFRERLRAERDKLPFEVRPCDPNNHYTHWSLPPQNNVWMKTKGPIPDVENLHHCALALISDSMLLPTALRPYGSDPMTWMTSLDHSVWFHAPFKADEWLLCEMESTRAEGGRAHTSGRIFTRDGTLAVTLTQEGVLRTLNPKSKL